MGFFSDIFGECFLIQNRHRLRYRRLWRRCNRIRCGFLCHARLSFACKQFVNRYAEKLRNLRHCCYIRQTVARFPFRHGAVAYIQLLCKLCLRQACVLSHFCYKFAYFGVVHIFNLAIVGVSLIKLYHIAVKTAKHAQRKHSTLRGFCFFIICRFNVAKIIPNKNTPCAFEL